MELKRFFYNWLQINIFKVHEAPFVKIKDVLQIDRQMQKFLTSVLAII